MTGNFDFITKIVEDKGFLVLINIAFVISSISSPRMGQLRYTGSAYSGLCCVQAV